MFLSNLFPKTYFCASPIFKKPTFSQINLIKKQKISFFILEKIKKNTASAQLWHWSLAEKLFRKHLCMRLYKFNVHRWKTDV